MGLYSSNLWYEKEAWIQVFNSSQTPSIKIRCRDSNRAEGTFQCDDRSQLNVQINVSVFAFDMLFSLPDQAPYFIIFDGLVAIYVSNGSDTIQKKTMMLSHPILAIVEIDEEIGMVVVRESDGDRSYTRVYWIS